MRRSEKFSLILILATFCLGIALYPRLPDQMAAHWNFAGNADGFMPKLPGTFFLPLTMLAVFGLYQWMITADPMKNNIVKSIKQFHHFLISIFIFFFYLFCLMMAWNLGYRFNMTQWIVPAVSMIFIAISHIIKDIQPNWTLGIKTPWTLSDKKVWRETHQWGSKMFRAASMVILAGVFLPQYLPYLFIAAILLAALVPTVYSYWKYKQLN